MTHPKPSACERVRRSFPVLIAEARALNQERDAFRQAVANLIGCELSDLDTWTLTDLYQYVDLGLEKYSVEVEALRVAQCVERIMQLCATV